MFPTKRKNPNGPKRQKCNIVKYNPITNQVAMRTRNVVPE